MKTKPFLLATAGSTVDGRTIDDKMLKEMASSYDPKTYTALLNIEHIRGVSGQPPFNSYGEVLELSTGDVEVNFNGKKETRLGLFGVFDVNDQAKALNDAGQKLFPSIEIGDNFGGKNFAYLMGCALTDSPAAIATQRMQFNRRQPGSLNLSSDDLAATLEFVDAGGQTTEDGNAFLGSLKNMFDTFAQKFAPKEDDKPKSEPSGDKPAAFNVAVFAPLFEQFTQTIAKEIGTLRTEFRTEVDGLAVQFKKLDEEREATPATTYSQRPKANGQNGNYAKTDC